MPDKMADKLLKDARLIRAMRSAGIDQKKIADTFFFLNNPSCSPEEYEAFQRRMAAASGHPPGTGNRRREE